MFGGFRPGGIPQDFDPKRERDPDVHPEAREDHPTLLQRAAAFLRRRLKGRGTRAKT